MSTSNSVESSILNSPISGSPIHPAADTDIQDFNPCCAAGMPAGNRVFYFKFVLIVFVVLGGGLYALYRWGASMGWFG